MQAGIFRGYRRPFPTLVPLVGSGGSLLLRLTGLALGRAPDRLGGWKMFARFDGCRVAGDVADEAVLLRLPDQSLVDELPQLHARELSEGTRKGGFMRHLPSLFPAADPPQLRIPLQSIQQLPGVAESVDGFSHEGTGNRQPVLGGAADPTSAAGHESCQGDQFQSRYQPFGRFGQFPQFQSRYQPFGRFGQFPQFLVQDREKLGLEHVSELRDLLAESKLHMGSSVGRLFRSNSLTPMEPTSKQNRTVLFYFKGLTQFCKRLL